MRWEWLFESDAKFNLMLNNSRFTPNIEEEKSPVYKYKNRSLRFVSIDYQCVINSSEVIFGIARRTNIQFTITSAYYDPRLSLV